MSPAERALWSRIQRRAALLKPEQAKALLKAFDALRLQMSEGEMARLIAQGGIEEIVNRLTAQAALNAAFQPVRDRFRAAMTKAIPYYQRDIPRPPSDKSVGFAFDFLNPRVIDAVRAVETSVVTRLADDARTVVRAVVERGLTDGRNPSAVAKDIRQTIGLSPSQWEQVANFRDALEGKNGRSLSDYAMRDKVLDRMTAKGPLTGEQVDRYVERYTKRRIAQNAEATAHTLAHDAQRVGQQQSYADAVDQGIVDGDRLMRQWRGEMDSRERPEHRAMEGETVRWDEPYSTGQMYAGQGDYNCRCIDRFFLASA